MEPDNVEPRFFHWIKKGLSDAEGAMDDARVHGGATILAYLCMGLYGIYKADSHDIAAFIQAWAIGGAALATGLGALFGLRKDN